MQTISILCAAAFGLAAANTALAGGDAVRYESAFSDYTPRHEVRMTDWRAANAAVSGGGHAGHGAHAASDDIPSLPIPDAPARGMDHADHAMPMGENPATGGK